MPKSAERLRKCRGKSLPTFSFPTFFSIAPILGVKCSFLQFRRWLKPRRSGRKGEVCATSSLAPKKCIFCWVLCLEIFLKEKRDFSDVILPLLACFFIFWSRMIRNPRVSFAQDPYPTLSPKKRSNVRMIGIQKKKRKERKIYQKCVGSQNPPPSWLPPYLSGRSNVYTASSATNWTFFFMFRSGYMRNIPYVGTIVIISMISSPCGGTYTATDNNFYLQSCGFREGEFQKQKGNNWRPSPRCSW